MARVIQKRVARIIAVGVVTVLLFVGLIQYRTKISEEKPREDQVSSNNVISESPKSSQSSSIPPKIDPPKQTLSPKPEKQSIASSSERPGWEILSEKERAELPECGKTLMTVSPVPIDSITGIEPIGSSNPPEHTLASISSDTYIGVTGQGTTKTTPLVAPGDMWIILINPRYGITQDPEDHVIKYAFCKDVYGVVDHVKSLSPEMQALVDSRGCAYPGGSIKDNTCPILLMEPIKAGTPLGTVGRLQGNFNFGTWDLRVTHTFANASRHGHLTKHSTCPFDYFSSPLKETLIGKLDSKIGGSCGSVEYDVPGTLMGDWFIGDASPTRHADWSKLLYFGPNNRDLEQSVISVSGIIVSQPTKWVFEPLSSGTINRKFKDVTPDVVYCYDNNGSSPLRNYGKGIISGRFILKLTSNTELMIEYQNELCQGTEWKFKNPTVYIR